MLKKTSTLLLVFCLLTALLEGKKKPYVILDSREVGMFSVVFDVLAMAKFYEAERYQGMEVKFKKTGLYYEKTYGPNWWNYYFEPIRFGTKKGAKKRKCLGSVPFAHHLEVEEYTTRKEAAALVSKYIHLKPHIEEKIQRFTQTYFENSTVIGIHYRGTDKISEAPAISFEDVTNALTAILAEQNITEYKIFIATDEQAFIDYMTTNFPNKICYLEEASRSIDGIAVHHNPNRSPYKVGEEALIDCVLLSKTDYLIRMSSNLSLCSTFFSPKLPVYELNQRSEQTLYH